MLDITAFHIRMNYAHVNLNKKLKLVASQPILPTKPFGLFAYFIHPNKLNLKLFNMVLCGL